MKVKSRVASPCISVCSIEEETGLCRGCRRSLMEIADWDDYSDAQKRALLVVLAERKTQFGSAGPYC